MKRRSVSLPIVLASVAVALSIALLVGWTLFVLKSGNTGLMVVGIISFAVIMGVIVLSAFFLVREILEVRRQTTFIDAVTHELKSPLAALRLCAETLARPQLDDARRAELRAMMVDDVERLSGVVDGILDASRLVAGSVPREVRHVAVRPILDQSVRRVLRRRGVDKEVVAVEGDPEIEIFGDRRALASVFENLIDNAIKYADPERGPEVHLSLHAAAKDRVVVEVRDSGIGIPRRDLRRIFNRFYRAPEEAVRAQHGTGLGLFVVHALVRDMGGRIEVESEGPGKGSCFRVTLPRRR